MSDKSEEQDQRAMDDPLAALGRAAEQQARKDEVTTSALLSLRRSRIYMAVISVVAVGGIAYGSWQAHDTNQRGVYNSAVLLCMAGSEQDVARYIHTLIHSNAKAPAGDYEVPADCALVK